MLMIKDDLKDWYDELSEKDKMNLWKRFARYLNNYELKTCMNEIKRGSEDLFEIHYKHGYIEKYQIYFYQIMRNLTGEEERDGCED